MGMGMRVAGSALVLNLRMDTSGSRPVWDVASLHCKMTFPQPKRHVCCNMSCHVMSCHVMSCIMLQAGLKHELKQAGPVIMIEPGNTDSGFERTRALLVGMRPLLRLRLH